MLCQVPKLVSQMSNVALYSKTSRLGFLLDDDEARQYVYTGVEDWAADNDDSPDDSMFHGVCTSSAVIPRINFFGPDEKPL